MSASFEDCRAGWMILRDFNFQLSRHGLNEILQDLGHHPVSKRTYQHYQRLRRHRHAEYIPINRFDVITTIDREKRSSKVRA